jgi:ribonucleoside-diphosphate reductase beta chain
MARAIEDIVNEVEQADIKGLEKVDVENVYQQMDHLMQERPSPMDLYDRWEKQQWAVADLDFTLDKEHWNNLKAFPGIGDQLQQTWTLFFIGEQAVTDTLGPILHAAPTEADRIFLSTQVVDEARHTVFFMRFFDEVLGISGGLEAALNAVRPDQVAGFQKIFETHLAGAVDAVRQNPSDYATWLQGITIYHFVVEGMLALTGQKFILRTIRQFGIMPGFYSGFTAVTRDESRHVNYGVGALRDGIVAGHSDAIESMIEQTLEPACWTILAPDREVPIEDPSQIPAELQISPVEIREFSLQSLTKRLRVAGLSKEFCDKVTLDGNRFYENGVKEYEDRFGKEHPIRWWERQAS